MMSLTHSQQNQEKLREPSPALSILSLVLRHALGNGDSTLAYAHHLRRIEALTSRNATIELVLPAFPAKSPNPEKTLSRLPDYAEVLGLQRLQKTCDDISSIYAPGARVVICSDGRVFSDLVLVDDADVTAYGSSIRAIISEFGLRSLNTFDMDDVFKGGDFDAMRTTLVARHARSIEQIRSDVALSAEARAMFNGIHRFIFEDRVVLQREKSRSRVREESKQVAYQVIQRSNAWSALVEEFFPHALRLSIHPQASASAKLGFQLVSCENAWGTPWHNVACLGQQGFRLLKRKDAEACGARLEYAAGKYPFFVKPGCEVAI